MKTDTFYGPFSVHIKFKFKFNDTFYQCTATTKKLYIYKSTVGKGKQQGENEFPYKNCCPKIKDKTIKNRISNM